MLRLSSAQVCNSPISILVGINFLLWLISYLDFLIIIPMLSLGKCWATGRKSVDYSTRFISKL